jgi:glycosyltransferase involved in cell wall biosynthesis
MINDDQNSYVTPVSQTKILHLLPNKNRRFPLFENLVTGLDKRTFCQILCYLSGDDKQPGLTEKWGYQVIDLGIPKKKLRYFRPAVVFQLARIVREQNIDIIHCQRHKCTVYGTVAAWIAGKRVKAITTVHGLNRTRTLGRKCLNHVLFNRIARIIAVSKAVRSDILNTNRISSPDKVVAVYNGIDAQQFGASNLTKQEARSRLGLADTEAFVFGTVGRLTSVKGQAVLLKAFAIVCQKYPRSRLVLAGKGPLEMELRNVAAKLHIDGQVIFLGHRNDIPEVLRAYDVFVLPSFSEGLCLALLEAMASGVPVIASRVGGIPEILNGPDLGMMVSPSSIEELALAMERFCGMDQVKRDEIGKALRDRVLDEFTKGRMVSAMAKEYTAVMNEAQSR